MILRAGAPLNGLPKHQPLPPRFAGPRTRNLAAEYAERERRRNLDTWLATCAEATKELAEARDSACQYPLACRHCSYRGRTEWPLDAGNWECPVCGGMQKAGLSAG